MENDLKDDFVMLSSTIGLLHAMSDFVGKDKTLDASRRIILVQALSANANALGGVANRLEERFKVLGNTIEEAAGAPDFYEDEEKKLVFLRTLKISILLAIRKLPGLYFEVSEMLNASVQSIDIIIRETEELLAKARGEVRE
jgi:hypothetical protein